MSQLGLDFGAAPTSNPKTPTLPKREAKKQFRALLAQASARGLSASTSYDNLKKAKKYALTHGLDFPPEAQAALSSAARRWLFAYLDSSSPRA